jgi:hypothetical protein
VYIGKIPDKNILNQIEGVIETYKENPNIFEILRELNIDAVVYGGAVRDSLAGLPLLGDIDIAITKESMKRLIEYFEEHTQLDLLLDDTYMQYVIARAITSIVNIEYKNINVQFVVLEESSKLSVAQRLRNAAEDVDLICCAVFLTLEGEVYEAVKGAYEDCKQRVLRINAKGTNFSNLSKRIRKLEKRGWSNKIPRSEVKYWEDRMIFHA